MSLYRTIIIALLVVAIDLFDCNQRVDNIPQELWMLHFALIQVLKSTGRPTFVVAEMTPVCL